jgi:hypothetical protein
MLSSEFSLFDCECVLVERRCLRLLIWFHVVVHRHDTKTPQIDPYWCSSVIRSPFALSRAFPASFLKPFSMHFGSSKRCFRDCWSILSGLGTLLEWPNSSLSGNASIRI